MWISEEKNKTLYVLHVLAFASGLVVCLGLGLCVGLWFCLCCEHLSCESTFVFGFVILFVFGFALFVWVCGAFVFIVVGFCDYACVWVWTVL